MNTRTIVGFDCETHLITPGRLAPPVVCLTLAGAGAPLHEIVQARTLRPEHVVIETVLDGVGTGNERPIEWAALITSPPLIAHIWRQLVERATFGGIVLVGCNTPFDLAVLVDNALLHGDDTAIDDVFDALEVDGNESPAACTIRDVRIREQLLAIEGGWFDFDHLILNVKPKFSLAEIVLRRFGVDISESKTDPSAWRLRYAELANVPANAWPAGASSYALDDARWTVRIAVDQSHGAPVTGAAGAELIDRGGNVTDECAQTRAAWALHLIAAWGLRTDPVASREWEAMVRAKVAEGESIAWSAGILKTKNHWRQRDGVCRLCGAGPTPNGPTCPTCGRPGETGKDMARFRQVVETAYRRIGSVPELTDAGAISTSRATLKASDDPTLIAYADLGVYSKNLSTHVPRLAGGFEHAVTYGINVLVRSGRTSSSTHQPPRGGGFRECHVPRPGYLYCSVDYDIAELKALAQIQLWWFRQSALADAINAGEDPHLSFGVDLLNRNRARGASAHATTWTYADVKSVPKDKAHPYYDAVHGAKGARQLAKIANFGFPGGLGSLAFVEYARGYGVELDDADGSDLRAAWLEKWREMPAYFNTIGAACEGGGGEFALLQAVSNRQRGRCGFTQACNGYFQGLVADFAKRATWEVQRAAYASPRRVRALRDSNAAGVAGVRSVLFVHDEVFFEVPAPWAYDHPTNAPAWTPEQTTDACDGVARIMVDVAQRYVPDVRMSAAPALMRRWYKGADTVRDAGGYLQPWEPTAARATPADVEHDEDNDAIDDG